MIRKIILFVIVYLLIFELGYSQSVTEIKLNEAKRAEPSSTSKVVGKKPTHGVTEFSLEGSGIDDLG